MILQKDIFEAATNAFAEHHPKFPWPKKHELEDQTDDFKRAFLAFSTDINAMHNAAKEHILETKQEYVDLAGARLDTIYELRDKNDSLSSRAVFGWILAIVFLLTTIGFATGKIEVSRVCVSNPEEYNFRFTDSVVVYDVFGNKEVKPICD